jgi:transposase
LDVNRNTVILWCRRFQQKDLDGLWEIAPGRGPKPTYGSEKVASIIDATLRREPEGTTQRSCRLMAASQGVSKSTIKNIWQSHNLKPHRVKTFKRATPNSWRS